MNVNLIKTQLSGKPAYSIAPADPNNHMILMVGVASLRSVKKTCKNRGYTIVGTIERGH